MFYVARMISFIIALSVSGFAFAGSLHTIAGSNFQKFGEPIVVTVAANGWAGVREVYYPGGRIVNGSGKNWTEYGSGNGRFNFMEVGRDNSSIYLRDNSRGVNLQINLQAEKIFYSDDTGQSFPLYDVTGIDGGGSNQGQSQIGQAASIETVEYSCNEGIPLLLEFETVGDEMWVTWTHDTYRGNRLPQVVSGSGNRFSDGRNDVFTKGRSAFVNLDGIEDSCTQVN